MSDVDIIQAMREAKRIAAHDATDMYEPLSNEWHRAFIEISNREYRMMVTPPNRCRECGK